MASSNNQATYTVDVEYLRADGNQTIKFPGVPIIPGGRVPKVGETVKIECRTRFNYGAIISNFKGFKDSLIANTGKGDASAVVVTQIINPSGSPTHMPSGSGNNGYATVLVKSLSQANDPTASGTVARVLNIPSDISNLFTTGMTEGILATDTNDGNVYFLTNEQSYL